MVNKTRNIVLLVAVFALVFVFGPVCFSDIKMPCTITIPGGCGSQHCIGEILYTELTIKWEGYYTLTRTTAWGEEIIFSNRYLPAGTHTIPGQVAEPEGEHILTLYEIFEGERWGSCRCSFFAIWCDCDCPDQCFWNDLWAMKCVNGSCVKDYIIERNSRQCGYNPCGDVRCSSVCRGEDLWSQECVEGECVLDEIIESNSRQCGYNPCENHCTNREQDCEEYGVDCGGGCPFIDSDADGVEDCMDMCPNSQCNRVDVNGCETDLDGDGVKDCQDQCPTEKGDSSNKGCPSNVIFWVTGIGGIAAAAGGLAFNKLKGGNGRPSHRPSTREPSQPTTRTSDQPRIIRASDQPRIIRASDQPRLIKDLPRSDMGSEAAREALRETAEEASKRAGERVAEEASKKVGTKVAGEASKKVGTKVAGEASKKVGTKVAEEASKKVGTKVAEEASKKVGTKVAEEASKKVGTKVAATAATGITGTGAARKTPKEAMCCPKCGEKILQDSKFCSNCGHTL